MSAPQLDEANLSLAERAYHTIRDRLVTLEIRPGTAINDEQLAHSLGCGRTPVREALKRLETERLVVAFPRRGTFATDVNITDLRHISEVRRQLEPTAAAAAAARATESQRATLSELLTVLKRHSKTAVTSRELMRLDMQVHRAIYAATGNPYLEDTLVRYDNLATRIWCLFADRLPDLAGHVSEHGPLLQAILDGDEKTSRRLAGEHVEHFERAIRSAI